MVRAKVAELPADELAKISQCTQQALGIEILIENDQVYVGRMITKALMRKCFCRWQKVRLSVTILQVASEIKTGSQSTTEKVT